MIRLTNVCGNCGEPELAIGPVYSGALSTGAVVTLVCAECGAETQIELALVPACRICEVAPAEDETGLCGGCKDYKYPALDRREEEDVGW